MQQMLSVFVFIFITRLSNINNDLRKKILISNIWNTMAFLVSELSSEVKHLTIHLRKKGSMVSRW